MKHTLFVFSRSNSTDLILSRESVSIFSFSAGIPAGLLLSSSNTFSSFWRRSIHGRTWSSFVGSVTGELLLVLYSTRLEGRRSFCLLRNSNSKQLKKATTLTKKDISILAAHWIFRFSIFSLMVSNQWITELPEIQHDKIINSMAGKFQSQKH